MMLSILDPLHLAQQKNKMRATEAYSQKSGATLRARRNALSDLSYSIVRRYKMPVLSSTY